MLLNVVSLSGLGAVATGIVPKMAIRFAAFERYKAWLTPASGKASSPSIFLGQSLVPSHVLYQTPRHMFHRLLADLATSFPFTRTFDHCRKSTCEPCTAGLGAGVTEAVAVVGPMEVIKIRLQAQHHSMTDPLDIPKYRNAAHALYVIIREEGVKTLYR